MARKKVQKNFQFPPKLADWLERESDDTGVSKSRIGIAAMLAYRTRSFVEKRLLIRIATRVHKGTDTWDAALKRVLLRAGEIRSVDEQEDAEIRREVVVPSGEQHWFGDGVPAVPEDATKRKRNANASGKKP